ncbi:MAG: hypothetical protein A2939_02025 [Parcubacteria group bacterium RIFCSPLOWO2_01_FULL_48_18]|nr:MAG: hypothetical protein A2939_02025 [Parcubacteria group bacterium RIFCSPLOWO2_01_FULL_48_18]
MRKALRWFLTSWRRELDREFTKDRFGSPITTLLIFIGGASFLLGATTTVVAVFFQSEKEYWTFPIIMLIFLINAGRYGLKRLQEFSHNSPRA